MSGHIFLDTETAPTQNPEFILEIQQQLTAERDEELAQIKPPGNLKKQESIDAWWADEAPAKRDAIVQKFNAEYEVRYRATGLDPAMGQLVVVAAALNNEEPVAIYDKHWNENGYEAWLLAEAEKMMSSWTGRKSGFTLVGHNIGFDRGFLRCRGMVHRVKQHRLITVPVKPWETDVVCDTMTEWTGDPRKFISMNKLCKALGMPGKPEDIDGSKVYDFLMAGKIDRVAEYCRVNDVGGVRDLFCRMRGINHSMLGQIGGM